MGYGEGGYLYRMKELTKEELLDEIERVCLPGPIPMPGELDLEGTEEDAGIVSFLQGRIWKEVTLESLHREYEGDPAILPSRINGYGYSYYVGSFLEILLKDGRACGTLSFGIIWSLIRNFDRLSVSKCKVGRDILRIHKRQLDPESCHDGDIIDAAIRELDKRVREREDETAPDYTIFS